MDVDNPILNMHTVCSMPDAYQNFLFVYSLAYRSQRKVVITSIADKMLTNSAGQFVKGFKRCRFNPHDLKKLSFELNRIRIC